MRKNLPAVFTIAATVVFILGSGPVKSQDKKNVSRTVIISNGDTVINGKKLSESAPAERKKLLKELSEMEEGSKRVVVRKQKDGKDQNIVIQKSGKEPSVLRWRSEDGLDGDKRMFRFNADSLVLSIDGDSLSKNFRFKIDGLDSNMRQRIITMDRSFDGFPSLRERSRPGMFIERSEMMDRIASRPENSQVFNYVSTDKDGISSRMSIRVSEPGSESLKKLINSESIENGLEVNDLTLSPNFSNGKLNLSFNLMDKSSVEVKIMDNSYKEIFTDKTGSSNGSYFKQISLAKNGIYYIVINQGNKTFVRKIIKE